MFRPILRVVLYAPEIPPNTGNIIRLCANTGLELNLIEPLGFDLDEPKLRRAGLDYHEWARVRRHPDLGAFASSAPASRLLAFTTRATRRFDQFGFEAGDALVFGPESRGLPDHVLEQVPGNHRLRLPMVAGSRSLNLSNAVAVACYEAWRQLGYPGGV